MSRTTRRLAGVAVAGVCAAAALATPAALADNGKGKSQGPLLDIQILSFNDFHGNLEPISETSSSGRVLGPAGNIPAGGVEYLATHLEQARQGQRNTITVAAGDLVGATPLLSAAFHDEPTVESMNLLGLDASAVGNHEFDEGYQELRRLQNGGCIDDGDGKDNQNSCPDGSFEGADFQYLAANVIETATGKTILPSYTIENRDGAKIAFIGMTLEGTPDIVTAAGVRGLAFKDEVETANALVPELKKKGVNAIVVLVHEGGVPPSGRYDYACDGTSSISGPIVDIATHLDPEIDMVISGHTHQPYVCNIPDPEGKDRLVTSASSFGRLYTETNVKYDRRTQDIVRGSVAGSNVVVTRDVPRNALQTELIAKYQELVAPVANRVIGQITKDVTKTQNAAGESQLGDLIADAQLADPTVVGPYAEPVVAFMNPGGIRGDLTFASSAGEGDGVVTFGEAFTVQPFNNYLVSLTMTGAQIKTLLTQQWTGRNLTSNKILQVSGGFAYSYTVNPDGSKTLGAVTLEGAPLADGQTYRIVTNNFLADGGDGFAAFTGGQDKYFGGLDIDAFANHLEANSPYTPGALTRITKN
jgi:5'-nucleotidase